MNRIIKYTLWVLLALIVCVPANAVLKERDLANTLYVLRAELEHSNAKMNQMIAEYDAAQKDEHARLESLMERCNNISLMLYSQRHGHVFDIMYACQEATTLYYQVTKQDVRPYNEYIEQLKNELERYDGLIKSLKELTPDSEVEEILHGHHHDAQHHHEDGDSAHAEDAEVECLHDKHEQEECELDLTPQQIADRDRCLVLVKNLRENTARACMTLEEDRDKYDFVIKRVTTLNEFAMEKYKELREDIFVNGSSNYFSMLMSLPQLIEKAKSDVDEKYMPLKTAEQENIKSDWRGAIVMSIMVIVIFYIIIASLLCLLVFGILHYLGTKLNWKWVKSDFYQKKRTLVVIASGMFVFALSLGIAQAFFIQSNFLKMAVVLLSEFTWLMEAILISIIIRTKVDKTKDENAVSKQIKGIVKLYTPFIVMTLIVVTIRIMFVPSNVVNLFYPPVLLVFTLWQFRSLRSHHRKSENKVELPRKDKIYTILSAVMMIVATIAAFIGFTLVAVEIMIWWMFQLAAIHTIQMLYTFVDYHKEKKIAEEYGNLSKKELKRKKEELNNGHEISKTWVYDMANMAIIPVLSVLSVLFSIFMAADMFDMAQMMGAIFFENFLDIPDTIQLSLFKMCLVICWYFIFGFINYIIFAIYRLIRISHEKAKTSGDEKSPNLMLAKNIIAILSWGAYILFSLMLLQVPKSGLSVIAAGLATGMGFAMKDLLENFFYGISLMSGRIRKGDFVECDGIVGVVKDITYQSTHLEALDGAVIAFLNSQLFTKNFKNLTTNHGYVKSVIPVGVKYGSEVPKVRQIIQQHLDAFLEKWQAQIDEARKKGEKLPNIVQGRIASPKFSGEEPHYCLVEFSNFGDNSVDLNVISWPSVQNRAIYESRIKEEVYAALNNANIEIPFPQRDIHIIQ